MERVPQLFCDPEAPLPQQCPVQFSSEEKLPSSPSKRHRPCPDAALTGWGLRRGGTVDSWLFFSVKERDSLTCETVQRVPEDSRTWQCLFHLPSGPGSQKCSSPRLCFSLKSTEESEPEMMT